MNKKMLLVICGFVMLLVVGSVFGNKSQPTRPHNPQNIPAPSSEPIPEPVVYSTFFNYVVHVKEQADETENKGKSAASLRAYFQNQAGLTEDQARLLNDLAAKCVTDVARQDAIAQEVVNKFQSQFPNGRIPKGTKLPPPPASLAIMQQERNRIILQARESLQLTLGEIAFNKVRNYIAVSITPNIKAISLPGK